MRALSAGTNVDPSTADYPNGRVRDKAGATAGTIVNEVLLGDITQAIQALLEYSSVVPNGNPDNVTNGYQILEALSAWIIPEWVNISLINGWAGGSNTARYRIHRDGTVEIDVNIDTDAGSPTNDVFGVLPVGARPSRNMDSVIEVNQSQTTRRRFVLESNGNVSIDYTSTDIYSQCVRIALT